MRGYVVNKKIIVLGWIIIWSSVTELSALIPVAHAPAEIAESDDQSIINDLQDLITYDDFAPLKALLTTHKTHKLVDGSTLADYALSYALEVFAQDAGLRSPECIKIALEYGADPNKQLAELRKIKKDDHIELFLLKLFVQHGATLDKTLT